MATKSLRIDEKLFIQAQRQSVVEHRSANEQIQYWAKLGQAIASKISAAEAFSVTQGLREIRLESPRGVSADPEDVLDELEADRAKGFSGKPVTAAPFYFEASPGRPGLLDMVNSITGERRTGSFRDGEFKAE